MTNDELLTLWAIRIVQSSKGSPRQSPGNLPALRSACINSIGLTAAMNIWECAVKAADSAVFAAETRVNAVKKSKNVS